MAVDPSFGRHCLVGGSGHRLGQLDYWSAVSSEKPNATWSAIQAMSR